MKMSKGDGTTKCGEFVKKGKRREFGDSTEFSYISYQTKKMHSQEIEPVLHEKKSHSCCKYVGCIFFRCLVRVILLLGRRGRVTRVFSSSKNEPPRLFKHMPDG